MSHRTWLALLCLVMCVASTDAVCFGDNDLTPPPGVALCTGSYDSAREHWPRLPTDAEIETAKEAYLAYLQEGDSKTRIDDVRVEKFHTCEGSWVNQVVMRVDWSWWWSSTTGEGEWKPAVSDTSLVYTPGTKAFEFVLTHVPSAYFSGLYGDPPQGFATGACSDVPPTTTPRGVMTQDGGGDGGIPWILVVGALGALGAAGLVGAKVLGGRKGSTSIRTAAKVSKPAPPREKTEKDEEKEEVTYILQLSADRLVVTPDQPAALTATVWKRTGDGAPVPAPGAQVSIENPAGSGLSVSLSTGGSPLQTEVAVTGEPGTSPVTLEVTATAGKTSTKAVVTVEVTGRAEMEFY